MGDNKMSEIQKSPNWDKRCDFQGFLREGFPFDEGWPKCGPGDGMTFDLVLRDGEKCQAYVDFSTQHRAEGLQWRRLTGQSVSRSVVIAWREHRRKF